MTKPKSGTRLTFKPSESSFKITREFDAPRNLVFRAFSDPDLYARWHACEGMRIRAETFECRTGGSYRIVEVLPSNVEVAVRGVYHEVRNPDRIVKTIENESDSGRLALEVTLFEALPGNRTRLTSSTYMQSSADRDEWIRLGVEKGTREAHEKLDQLLEIQQMKERQVENSGDTRHRPTQDPPREAG